MITVVIIVEFQQLSNDRLSNMDHLEDQANIIKCNCSEIKAELTDETYFDDDTLVLVCSTEEFV